ncbi:MAG: LuxR family transcriptional regulator [Myxococcales bacterium]|nr:LuxR family transcriptional regulator [Myxococcales bacterium]
MERTTHSENTPDFEGESEDEGISALPPRRALAAGLFLLIAALMGLDLVVDWLEGGSSWHLGAELVVILLALSGVAILVRDLGQAHARGARLARDLVASHRDAERYRAEAAEILAGLSEAIDVQLGRWGLTGAEKEVAILLLKGLSHKEVAEIRNTSERTARKQAHTVYQKASLEGRAALSAFFLEDLLPGQDPREGSSR